MRMNCLYQSRRAFTRVECLACLACAGLLLALALPAFAAGHSRSQVAQCLNNLRLVGRAVQMWGMEHRDLVPWRLPAADGGHTGNPIGGNAWIHFQIMSNELATPRILACPADTEARVASEFTGVFSRGGYMSIGYRAEATSYFINLHTSADNPRSAIHGDRNIRFSYYNPFPCGVTGIVPVWSLDPFDPYAGWTNAIHGVMGNVVLMDGSVATTTKDQLRAGLDVADGNAAHLLKPR